MCAIHSWAGPTNESVISSINWVIPIQGGTGVGVVAHSGALCTLQGNRIFQHSKVGVEAAGWASYVTMTDNEICEGGAQGVRVRNAARLVGRKTLCSC